MMKLYMFVMNLEPKVPEVYGFIVINERCELINYTCYCLNSVWNNNFVFLLLAY